MNGPLGMSQPIMLHILCQKPLFFVIERKSLTLTGLETQNEGERVKVYV